MGASDSLRLTTSTTGASETSIRVDAIVSIYFDYLCFIVDSSVYVCIITNIDKRNGENEMSYIINEIKGYMNHMSFEKAVDKVRRNHLGRKDYIITQAAKIISETR